MQVLRNRVGRGGGSSLQPLPPLPHEYAAVATSLPLPRTYALRR
jgi:hypothetical protein